MSHPLGFIWRLCYNRAAHAQHRGFQRSKIVLDNRPKSLHVDSKISMNQQVSRGADFSPAHARFARRERTRKVFAGLADDFDLSNHGILNQGRGDKRGPPTAGVLANRRNAFKNVVE